MLTKEEFIKEIASILEVDVNLLTLDKDLNMLVPFDSLIQLGIIAMFDKQLNKAVTIKEIEKIKTLKELLQLAELN